MAHGVVFATPQVSVFSELQTSVNQALANDPTSQVGTNPTYWYLSFKDNRIKPLVAEVIQPDSFAVISSEDTLVFKDTPFTYSVLREGGEVIYGVVDLGNTESRPISATSDSLTYLAEGVSDNANIKKVELKKVGFYKTDQTTLSKDLFGDKTSTLYSQVTPLDDTHYLVAHSKKDNKTGSDLYVYDRDSGKRKRVIKDFDGVVNRVDGGAIAIKQGRSFNTIHSVTKDGVVTRLRIDANNQSKPSSAVLDKNGFIISGLHGEVYFVSVNKISQQIKPVYSGNLEKEISNHPNNMRLKRNIETPYDTSYNLTFNGKAVDAVNTLQSIIDGKGYDPYQFIITLSPGRTAEY
jgi:hypothetical protein